MKFKIWLEDLQSEKTQKLQKIWSDVFRALGIDGQTQTDNLPKSLSSITSGRNNGNGDPVKGKRAVLSRLSSIFSQLKSLGDRDIDTRIEDTQNWLTNNEGSADGKTNVASNADTTVGKLLQNLFGDQYFGQFVGDDYPKVDDAKAQVQPQPPKSDAMNPNNSMDQNTPQPPMPGPPMGGQMGQQPQANGVQMNGQPSNPMPPKPAGAEMGLF